MLKKLISYLVIFSILFVDGASCMQEGAGDKRPPLHRRRLSDGDIQTNLPRYPHKRHHSSGDLHPNTRPPPSVGVLEKEFFPPHGENAGEKDDKAPPPPTRGRPSPLPEEDENFVPPSSSEDEQDDDDFLFLPENLGSQLILNQVEEESSPEDLLNQEAPSQKYLRLLGINSHDLTPEESEALDKILRIEGSWKNHLVWANLEVLIHKSLFALTTNKHAVNKRKLKTRCAPLWLHGGPIPLDSDAAIKRNVILKTFGSSLEEGIIESIHAALLALMGYQFGKSIKSGEWTMDFGSLASFYFIDADAVSYLGTIRTLHNYPALFALLAVPLVYASANTVYKYWQISEPTDRGANEDIGSLTYRSSKWDSVIFNILSVIPFASSLLIFHPLKRKISGLTSLILWEGRLPPDARENVFTALLDIAHNRKGISKMAALESLARLAHGMNIRNLMLRPHDVEDLLHIKLRAFHALKEIYQEIPTFSLNKFRTAALLWDIGQSPSRFISIIEPINKTIRGVLYVYTLYGIIDVLIKYFTCPVIYLESFSWLNGGLQPYASDYSKECYDAQVAVFNTLPGQPASTLVGDLARYHFTGPYVLDFSNKNIQGPVIADVVEGFQKANVPLKFLDISYNVITNSSDVARILKALPPEIRYLDLSGINFDFRYNYKSSHFLGLGQLTGLQSFNISDNGLYPDDIGVIGQALQNLSHLKELRLMGNGRNSQNTNITQIAQSLKPSLTLLDLTTFYLGFDLEGRIALGNSLAQVPTLRELYLAFTGIGGNDQTNRTLNEAALLALAHGISAQQNLRILDLSNNGLGQTNNNVSVLLSSLPSSLTDLDVSLNRIGFYSDFSEVKALAQAVQHMSELTSFRAGGAEDKINNNRLGNSPNFLKALKGKQNLIFLDLSWNSCNDSMLIRDLLRTTPNLEFLNLSNNQLTHGSLLVPILSSLGKLKSLNLAGNNFTTADRVNLWKATSYLPKIPFYLDEDLNFASTYLKSFPSTTTRLNLAGLIAYDPTAFAAIMPQIANLFPNLRELDLSSNYIYNTYNNGTPIIGGIKALTSYLPRLTHLQSLRMSSVYIYYPDHTLPPELIPFSQAIGQLTNLHTLDLSMNPFLFSDSLGKGLENIHSLTSINLAIHWHGGPTDTWQGGIQLIQGLQAQSNLIHLNLPYNLIGLSFSGGKDPNSTLALAEALNSWPHLQSLNLADNFIGYEDPNGASTFLDKLADLALIVNKQGRTLEVDLFEGIFNVDWTQGARVLQTLTQQKIEDACARQLCTGDPISKSTQSETQARGLTPEVATSGAISSHQVPWYSPARWVTAWKSWWDTPTPVIDMTKPHMGDLVKLRDECDLLISRADLKTADEWYRRSLEDLREDVEKLVKNPTDVTDYAINRFYNRLKRIGRDFLKKPMLEKRSFFASSSPIDNPMQDSRNMIELALPVSMPLLQSGPVPLALGY